MWAGPEKYVKSIRERWPCPDRVLSLPESLVELFQVSPEASSCVPSSSMSTLVEGMNSLLEMAADKIDGMNRWKCSQEEWDVNLEQMRGKK